MKLCNIMLLLLPLAVACQRVDVVHINNMSSEISLKKGDCLLLPIEDKAPEAVLTSGEETWSVRFSRDSTEYLLPFTAEEDMVVRIDGLPFESRFYRDLKKGKASEAFVNRTPYIHFRPLYGWINDPNGMFYKNGEWHLFYQYNPFGAKWGNMSWGHAVSEDLVNWRHLETVLKPDSLGMIFSGSAVVDCDGTAGFGDDAVVAVYTSAGRHQQQSVAYSNDDGRSFIKYGGNPVLGSSCPDFRDPKVIWHPESNSWIMVVAAGNAMQFYRSDDLREWRFASCFGENTGHHSGVWECPDIFPLPWKDGCKWVLLCSSNRSNILGSATQYFIGDFDGYDFVPDDGEIRWMDYGMDHYAAVTFSNAPGGRRISMAWMNNWLYADALPLNGWRGMMTVPREHFLMEYAGRIVMASLPVREIMEKCQDRIHSFTLTGSQPEIEFRGVKFRLKDNVLEVERKSRVKFSDRFDVECVAELDSDSEHEVLLLEDDYSIECFIDSGAVAMSFQLY